MARADTDDHQLSDFLKTGFYRFESSNVVFVDPVRVLNRSYTRFRVSPSSYYSRFFEAKVEQPRVSENHKKRKRKDKRPYALNDREQVADQRHQKAKPFLTKAHESLLEAKNLLPTLRELRSDELLTSIQSTVASEEHSFVEIGSVWQAPLFEITLYSHKDYRPTEGSQSVQISEEVVIPAFDRMVANETNSDMEAEFLLRKYIIPKQSSFYMSDLKRIHGLIPAESTCRFNLIVVDPPWENRSAYQKVKYPTLPNRYFLSLPIKQLAHEEGALVALWVTNKEKLRNFVEKDLFPKWGVKYVATHYWLKVKADGSLIGELDLFHHRPYECLLLGYCCGKDEDSQFFSRLKSIPDSQVIISIPGDYSRKPPIGELLLEYIPGSVPAHCIELFARELVTGWTSWGNEPLHFQDSTYFSRKASIEIQPPGRTGGTVRSCRADALSEY